ncbi:hypothetical protein CC2G_011382 [Coprinopsis cinerea AmutBmut pab1-1]|nr:hypothetical protein CC2G_011382 [Coprinopsis cinerea AmutBmut pab1-1]
MVLSLCCLFAPRRSLLLLHHHRHPPRSPHHAHTPISSNELVCDLVGTSGSTPRSEALVAGELCMCMSRSSPTLGPFKYSGFYWLGFVVTPRGVLAPLERLLGT